MTKVGDEIEVACGRCKEDRYHTVAALGVDGRIESVVCNFCHTAHKYRDPSKAARKPRASAARPRAPVDVDDGTAPARPYTPDGKYERGELLLHAKYGRGRVLDVRGDRIDVRFADGSVRVFVARPT